MLIKLKLVFVQTSDNEQQKEVGMANTQEDGIRENGSTLDVSFESSLILPCAVMITGRG